MTGAARVRARALVVLGLVALLGAATAPRAGAAEAPGYAGQAKSTILRLVAGRLFKPQSGCDKAAACAALLARLSAGDFTVVAPVEQSQAPDLPSYERLRRRCRSLDPLRMTLSHHIYAATRGFAAYRLNPPGRARPGSEILVFRGQHYAMVEPRGQAAAGTEDPATVLPGTFVVVSMPGCRLLATAQAEDGDRFAKYNDVGAEDHASELLELDGHYVVLNLTPVAGPHQPKASWWYTLTLCDLGPHADADLHHQHHDYIFSYKPEADLAGGAKHAAQALPSQH
jgi:hypothetical protein